MRISDVMTPDVAVLYLEDSLRTAAQLMADAGVSALPVCEGARLVGMVSDRDITARGGAAESTRVREVMPAELRSCCEDDETTEVLQKMTAWRLSWLPVVDSAGRLVGSVSKNGLTRPGTP
jgi:CBS domain-containing protein